ncbi:hypothetical protein BM221_008347 [Beauveria bassiana]|uniref:Uncharacterized protein n=1 Tax=Beauveria bassiana TaxID=176275 RepID=A0A2N6NFS6_BEABA|nr:hypothetical protein BM221_008347 [Beauveria bassiana]
MATTVCPGCVGTAFSGVVHMPGQTAARAIGAHGKVVQNNRNGSSSGLDNAERHCGGHDEDDDGKAGDVCGGGRDEIDRLTHEEVAGARRTIAIGNRCLNISGQLKDRKDGQARLNAGVFDIDSDSSSVFLRERRAPS